MSDDNDKTEKVIGNSMMDSYGFNNRILSPILERNKS